MALCQDIIVRALRKLNAVPLSVSRDSGAWAKANPDEAQNALAVLQSLYMELVGWGAFGRENDILAQGDWTVLPGSRVRMVDPSATANIPDEIPRLPPWWNYAGWGYDSWAFWPVWPVSNGGSCTCRAPDDLSLVTVVDPSLDGNAAHTYLYDAFVGRWMPLDGLILTTEAPLARRWSEPLANVLAGRLAPDYGQELSDALKLSIGNGMQAMCSRFSSATVPVVSEYI